MVKTKGLLYKRVHVIWEDIVTWGSWLHQHDVPIKGQPPAQIESIGWLSYIGDKYIILSSTVGPNEDGTGTVEYNQHITIPLGCIHEIKKV